MRENIERPEALVDVTGISHEIEERKDGSIMIGAGAKNTAIASHGGVRALPSACASDSERRLGTNP
jgi:xanthine dehydrogenase YagS FAD-binding subunit